MIATTACSSRRRPWGVSGLAIFFATGAIVAFAHGASLLLPDAGPAAVWRATQRAQTFHANAGLWAVGLMLGVAIACLLCALGLWTGASWGRWSSIGVLSMNALIDLLRLASEKDPADALLVPLVLILVIYLSTARVRGFFEPDTIF